MTNYAVKVVLRYEEVDLGSIDGGVSLNVPPASVTL
jgi:hypothetical protein